MVPSFEDVEHTQRELADGGAVFGARVLRFEWLFETIARRAGYREPGRVGPPARADRGGGRARPDLTALARVGAAPRLRARRGAARGRARSARWSSRPASPGAARLGRRRPAPRATPTRWPRSTRPTGSGSSERPGGSPSCSPGARSTRCGATPAPGAPPPVFVYGFDDFTAAWSSTRSRRWRACVGADVTVSLPYERGRAAFKAVATVFEQLSALASEAPLELPAVDDHYAPRSRAGAPPPGASPVRADSARRRKHGGAVRLLRGRRRSAPRWSWSARRGARAAARRHRRRATSPSSIRDPQRATRRWSSRSSTPTACPSRSTAGCRCATPALGRGAARAAALRRRSRGATPTCSPTCARPASCGNQALADRLEADVRQDGARDRRARPRAVGGASAGRSTRSTGWPRPRADGPGRPDRRAALPARAAVLRALRARARRGAGRPPSCDDARAFEAARVGARPSSAPAPGRPAPGLDRRRLHDTLAELHVRLGESPQPDRVLVATPEAIRARRFEAVFVCGLQEGEFPRGRRPEPFLPDDDRREIAKASGLVLPVREDRARARALPLLRLRLARRAAARAQLALQRRGGRSRSAARSSSTTRSDLFTEIEPRRRSLADVTWDPRDAPTEVEWERAARGARAAARRASGPDGLTAAALLERARRARTRSPPARSSASPTAR